METMVRPPPLTGPDVGHMHPYHSPPYKSELEDVRGPTEDTLAHQEFSLGNTTSTGSQLTFHPTSLVTPLSPEDGKGEFSEEKQHLSPQHKVLKHKQSRLNTTARHETKIKCIKPSVLSANAPPFTPQCLARNSLPASPVEQSRDVWFKKNASPPLSGHNQSHFSRFICCQDTMSMPTGQPKLDAWKKESHVSRVGPTDQFGCVSSSIQALSNANTSPLKYFKFLVAEDVAGFLVGRRGAGIEEFQKRNGPGLKVSVSKRGELFPYLFERIAVAVGVGEGFSRAVREVSRVVLERAMHKEEDIRIDTGKKIPKPKGCFKLVIPDAVLGHLFTPTDTGIIPIVDVAHRSGVEVISSAQGGILHTKLYPLGLNESIIQVIGTTENVPKATEQIVELYQGAPSLLLYLHLNYAEAHAAATPPPPPTPPPSPTSPFVLDKGSFFAHPQPQHHFSDGVLFSMNRPSREHTHRRSFTQGQTNPLSSSVGPPTEHLEHSSVHGTLRSAVEKQEHRQPKGNSSFQKHPESAECSKSFPQATVWQSADSILHDHLASVFSRSDERKSQKPLDCEEPYKHPQDITQMLVELLRQTAALQQTGSVCEAESPLILHPQSQKHTPNDQQLAKQLPLATLNMDLRELQRQTEELERRVTARLQQQTELLRIERQRQLLSQSFQEHLLLQVLQSLTPGFRSAEVSASSSAGGQKDQRISAHEGKFFVEQGESWKQRILEHQSADEHSKLKPNMTEQKYGPIAQNPLHRQKALPAVLGVELMHDPEVHKENAHLGGEFLNDNNIPSTSTASHTYSRPVGLCAPKHGEDRTINYGNASMQEALNLLISKLNCISSANEGDITALQELRGKQQISQLMDVATKALKDL